ncbi:MAG TPA: hypothetical protein VHY08_23185 [Bacillota bacterium]|nr:hypothetical protein [Bacillota bacterium]
MDTGFDIEKVRALLNIGQLTAESCKNCWAFRYCDLCASAADNNQALTAKNKLVHCRKVMQSTEKKLKDHCMLMEYGHQYEKDDFILTYGQNQGGSL